MLTEQLTGIQLLVIYLLPAIFAITIHEVAHGYMAYRLGDKTAKMLGRLSLNPLKHIDFLGTVFIPLLLIFFSGIIFGWAKPVPLNVKNLSNIKRDTALIALCGPLSNFAMAILWAIFAKVSTLGLNLSSSIALPLIFMGIAGVKVNVFLAILNLLPLPPLDGGHVISGILPNKVAEKYIKIAPFGIFILLILLVTGTLGTILHPVTSLLSAILVGN